VCTSWSLSRWRASSIRMNFAKRATPMRLIREMRCSTNFSHGNFLTKFYFFYFLWKYFHNFTFLWNFFLQKYFFFHHFFIKFWRSPKSYFLKISWKITKNRHFWPFLGPAGRPSRGPFSPIPDLRDLRQGRDSAGGGIISTPKIDFRADFRPS